MRHSLAPAQSEGASIVEASMFLRRSCRFLSES